MRNNIKNILTTTAIAISLGMLMPLSAFGQQTGNVGDAVGAANDAIGGAVGDVTGTAGDATSNQTGQNPNIGKGATTAQGPGKQVSRQANFGNLIAVLNNVNAQIQQVQALNNVNVVDVVDVNNLATGNNVQVLNNAINNNHVDIVELRNVLNKNNVIKNVLNKNKISINDVIAVDVLSGGKIIVFIS
jgi:hypothetical protein